MIHPQPIPSSSTPSLTAPSLQAAQQRGNPSGQSNDPASSTRVAIQPPHTEHHNTSAWAQYTIQVPNRAQEQEALKAAGIPTAVHYPVPLNRQPAGADPRATLPIGDANAECIISLPMHLFLENDLVKKFVLPILNATDRANQDTDPGPE